MNRGVRRNPSLGLILLIAELYRAMTTHGVPPITLSTIVVQVVIYLKLVKLPWDTKNACLSAYKIIYRKDYWKLLTAQLEHGDDLHLYYNMISFMWKGKSLEERMPPLKYALLLVMFTAATGCTYVGLNYALANFLDESYIQQCAVGFSGVIFALKVLTTHNSSGSQAVGFGPFRISVNSKYAVWVELLLISMITPNASFVGHLAGILVGLAYVYGPLKSILDMVCGDGRRNTPFSVNRSQRFTSTSQSTGYAQHSSSRPSTNFNYAHYVPSGMSEEEQLRRAESESRQQNYGWRPQAYSDIDRNTGSGPERNIQPSADELRRIRLERYN